MLYIWGKCWRNTEFDVFEIRFDIAVICWKDKEARKRHTKFHPMGINFMFL